MLIGASIILFHPLPVVIQNINSYLDEVHILYVIDNSVQKDEELLKQITNISPKCKIVNNPTNYGIAKALNQAVELAINDGVEWLLTMDQDSRFYDGNYFKAFRENSNKSNVAIFTPQIIFNTTEIEHDKEIETKFYSDVIMTSGSILNLKIYQKLGGFETKLFIDEVDTDYCYKVLEFKFKIVVIEGTYLIHSLGKERLIKLPFNKTIRIFEHQPFRHYYITRNYFYLLSKYLWSSPKLVLNRGRKVFFVKTMNGLLFHKKRFAVIKYSLKGLIDFVINKYGILR